MEISDIATARVEGALTCQPLHGALMIQEGLTTFRQELLTAVQGLLKVRIGPQVGGVLGLDVLPEHHGKKDQDADAGEIPEALHEQDRVFKIGFHESLPQSRALSVVRRSNLLRQAGQWIHEVHLATSPLEYTRR